MSQIAIPLPVSVEQIAIAIRQMTKEELKRLFELVPDLHKKASEAAPPPAPAWPPELDALRAQVIVALGNKPLTPDEPFIGGLTIAEYDALSEEQKDKLWDELADVDPMDMEEVEVMPDAVFA